MEAFRRKDNPLKNRSSKTVANLSSVHLALMSAIVEEMNWTRRQLQAGLERERDEYAVALQKALSKNGR